MKTFFRPQTIRWILISVVFGGLSGVLAAALTVTSLTDYTEQLSQTTNTVSSVNTSKFPKTTSTNVVRHVSDALEEGIVSIYPKSAQTPYGFLKESRIGTGVVVTSDGWIMAPYVPNVSVDSLRVQIKDRLFEATRLVFDPFTHTMFVKCDAENLSVVKFGTGLSISFEDQLFVGAGRKEFTEALFAGVQGVQGVLLSSDSLSKQMLLSSTSTPINRSMFDSSGSFVGFVIQKNDRAMLLPVEYQLPSLQSILEKKEITHPTLGVSYVDLSYAVGFEERLRRNHKDGAYITGHPAVKKGSAAAKAGILEGDIVLSVDGQDLNQTYGLSDVVLSHRVGDKLSFVIDRGGEKKFLELILDH